MMQRDLAQGYVSFARELLQIRSNIYSCQESRAKYLTRNQSR